MGNYKLDYGLSLDNLKREKKTNLKKKFKNLNKNLYQTNRLQHHMFQHMDSSI